MHDKKEAGAAAHWAKIDYFIGVFAVPQKCRDNMLNRVKGGVVEIYPVHEKAIELIKNAFRFVADFEIDILGAAKAECGNYLNQDLVGAKRETLGYLEVLKNVSVASLTY